MSAWKHPSDFAGQSADGATRIAFLGTYPPTQCGLATFSNSLVRAIGQVRPGLTPLIVRVTGTGEVNGNGQLSGAEWITDDPTSLGAAVDAIQDCDAVIVQHEYGIYGESDGEAIIELLEEITTPCVAVLHTVLADPTPRQRAILERIVMLADVTVTQSEAARTRLHSAYTLSGRDRVIRIPHGTWTRPCAEPEPGDRSRRTPRVLSWGLLGPGKGLEHGIAALAGLSEMETPPSYFIAGETHPKVRAAQGERYRETLRSSAAQLGLSDRVIFDDRYRDNQGLAALIRDCDVVLLPYDSREQVTSGVLVEALAAGKPVVATRFPHAVELLAGGAGLLVSHGDTVGMAEALRRVLTEPDLRFAMTAEACRVSAGWCWSAVAQSYLGVIDHLIEQRRVA